jgi:hypothetical protein
MSAQRLLPLCVILSGLLITPLSYCQEEMPASDTPVIRDGQVTPTACSRCGKRQCECELVCCPQIVTETEKKPFWKVTCEHVCIPGFRFPWECCKDQNGCCCREFLICGAVRTVNVLEQDEIECKTCGYKWEVKCVRRSDESWKNECQCPRCAARHAK